jgi:exodeoxyribonuclease X
MKFDQTILVWDTETTGLDPAVDRVVEIAAVPVRLSHGAWSIGRGFSLLVDPDREVPPEASAVHHITGAMCEDAPLLGDAVDACRQGCFEGWPGGGDPARPPPPEWPDYGAAHNLKFDAGFLPELRGRPAICTWRCALHLWPEAPGHSNQVLRYWLNLQPSPHLSEDAAYYPRAANPHSALYDAYVTAALLGRMLQDHTPEQLVELTGTPVVQTKIRFGKHRNERWTELPTDYLRWMGRQGDWDEDAAHTLKVELARRAALVGP